MKRDSNTTTVGTDAWHSDKWELFFRNYKRLYSKYQTVDIIQDKDKETPEVEIDESDTLSDTSESFIDIQAEREIKRGYSPDLGYYYNYIAVDMFAEQSKTFLLDYEDISRGIMFGINPVRDGSKTLEREDVSYLDEQLRVHPEAAQNGIREAVYRILKEAHHDYAMEIKDEFRARFKNIPTKLSLADIGNKHIGSIYSFEGFVTAVDDATRLLYKKTKWTCGSHLTEVEGRNRPPQCKYCNNKYLEEVPEAAVTETYLEFRLQQRHDQTKDGRIAVEREVVLMGDDMMDIIQGGDYIELTAIVKVRENIGNRKKSDNIADFYLEASYVERKPDDTMMIILEKDSVFLEDEVKEAVHTDTEDMDFEKLKMSVAPSVMGHEIVKLATLLQMASSDSKTFEDGTPHRGNLCILFCGSPSTAKTVIASYVRKAHIRGIMPSGKGISAAGLTATVDMKTNPPRLWAGAYLMAKNGIVVIDEMQTLDDDILAVLLEACEDAQTITITKAGIHRPLKADCASLHLSNPKKTAYWDDTKNIMENTGFKANLLSRYDAVIVFRDIPEMQEDQRKATHWLKNYMNASKDFEKNERDKPKLRMKSQGTKSGLHSLPYMAMWLRYVRKTFHPSLKADSEAYTIIQNFYLSSRKIDARFFAQDIIEEDHKQKIPSITMRQLASLIRWAEASARAHHRNIVEPKDAELACEIMRFSIMNSGFNPITKNAIAKEIDMLDMVGNPRVREIDVMRMSGKSKDRFYNAELKKFVKFERIMKRRAISKCLYCKGAGVQIVQGQEQDCNECQGFGCINQYFMLSDVEDALHPLGFTRSDVEDVAEVFEKRGLLKKDKYDRWQAAQRYSFKKSWGGIKMLEMNLEVAMDLDDNIKKLEALEAGLSEADRKKILDRVNKDLSSS